MWLLRINEDISVDKLYGGKLYGKIGCVIIIIKIKMLLSHYLTRVNLIIKKYTELIDGNSSEAQKELNIAGNKLQQSYELGLKCYLNRKYKELYDSKDIRWSEYSNLTAIIEKWTPE